MDKRIIGRSVRAAAAILTLSLAAACVTEPEDDHGDHAEPDGLVIRLGGTELVVVDEQTVTGELTVQAGQETAHLSVAFVDHDGDPVDTDGDYFLQVTVADGTVAEFDQDMPGEFGGHFVGLAAGTTTLTFSLMHGEVGTGHADYISPAITGTVTP